jgi:redox-sensing transcriptional repressor
VVLSVPDGVDIRKVDLSIELQILAYHEQRKSGEAELAELAELPDLPTPAMPGSTNELPNVGGGVGA